MGMCAALVDAQVAHQLTVQGAAREHALDGLLDNPFRMLAVENLARRPLLDAARIASVLVVNLVFAFGAGEDDLVGIDDDDVVTAIDMGCVDRSMFALEARRDESGEAADNEPFGIDENPLLLHRGRLGDIGRHYLEAPW